MSVFQTARYELNRAIKQNARYMVGSVLDVGSGSVGRYKSLLPFKTYTKLDIGGDVDIIGKADSIPCADCLFDSVISTECITCVFDVQKAFDEIHRILKPGGYALITAGLIGPIHHPTQDQWRFTPNSISTLCLRFRECDISRIGGFWSVGHQMVNRYFINRFGIYERSYRRIYDFLSKASGAICLWLDKIDRSEANRIFAHGYLVVLRK